VLAEVNRLKSLLPDEVMPQCMHAYVLEMQGKHEEAVKVYEEVIAADPAFIIARVRLAESHARHGDPTAAISTYQAAISYASPEETGRIQLSLGGLYEKLGNLQAAAGSYRAATEIRATTPLACNNLAWLVGVRQGNLVDAVPLAEQAIKRGGRRAAFVDTLGWLHHLKGDNAAALPLLEEARRGMPGHPSVRYHLGAVYLAMGRTAEGKSELEQALTLSSDFPEAGEARRLLQGLQ
jgi:tetratricopeptide (TPR) repeat protein